MPARTRPARTWPPTTQRDPRATRAGGRPWTSTSDPTHTATLDRHRMKKGAPRIVVRPLVCGPEGSGLFRQRRRDRLHHLGDALAQARVLDRVIGADQLERLAARHRIGWVLLILVPDDPRLHPARRMRCGFVRHVVEEETHRHEIGRASCRARVCQYV